MKPFARAFQRSFGVIVAVLAVLVAGTWLTIKITTEHLLYKHATSAAWSWARYLTENVDDLELIAAGEPPSASSMAFLEGARRSRQVFRYEILNRSGYAQLVSDHDKIALVDLAEFDPYAARSVASGQPVVDAKAGGSSGLPSYFAQAYVPVVANGRPIAIVAAYVDQTELRDSFYTAFSIAATILCMLTGFAFIVPAAAWHWRTREKQQADRRIRFMAHHDALTGLTNRARLIEILNSAVHAVETSGGTFALHFVDLDRFKEVNDTFGHDAGDFLLKSIAERLRSVCRTDDVVARIGGDEFIVLQRSSSGADQAEAFARRLADAVRMPMRFKDHDMVTTASIGVAVAPADGKSPDRLLKSADLALYRSKADGRNCIRRFAPEMDAELQARIELEKQIRAAVANNGFELHFQPLFQMATRRLTGFEALVRLPKGDGTLIPPATFIPIAEEIRVIDKIGAWVLNEACRIAATWPGHLNVAVNLSPVQFTSGSISQMVKAALDATGLAPDRLELEITESVMLMDSEEVMAELRAIKALGVAIAMDDFGTGYSSLSYLWRFPFDKIKIDGSFMRAFDGSRHQAETVVKTIIALGRELHMRVTVEGIETAEQAAFLDGANGDQAQGFFFGRPLPASELPAKIMAELHQSVAKDTARRSDGKLRVVK